MFAVIIVDSVMVIVTLTVGVVAVREFYVAHVLFVLLGSFLTLAHSPCGCFCCCFC